MLRRLLTLLGTVFALVGALGCSDDPSTTATTTTSTSSELTTTAPADDELATAFTWTTTWDLDGFGYVLTVDGTVGDDHAAYSMQVEPLLDGEGEGDDLTARTAGAVVNGLREAGDDLGNIDPDGSTEVRVDGTDRWYRNPWLIDEAAFAMDGAEWVHVTGDVGFVADLASYLLVERYDEALRTLLELMEADGPIQAPRAPPERSEIDALLTPWIGLTGPSAPDGAPAVRTGNAGEGTVTWEQTLTYEPDGADGVLAGEVTWLSAAADLPDPPAPGTVIELSELADALSQAG